MCDSKLFKFKYKTFIKKNTSYRWKVEDASQLIFLYTLRCLPQISGKPDGVQWLDHLENGNA